MRVVKEVLWPLKMIKISGNYLMAFLMIVDDSRNKLKKWVWRTFYRHRARTCCCGHSLTSRGQGRIFRVTAHRSHGSVCNGGFGRCESKKAGLRVNKVCFVDFHPSKIKILKNLEIYFLKLDFRLWISFLCMTSSKKVFYLYPQNIDSLLPGGLWKVTLVPLL